MSTFYKHNDKTSGDGLATTDWNELSNAVAGNQGLHLAIDTTNKIGIGTEEPINKLDVEGGVAIGTTYPGTNAAPSDGLLVEGSVGIGTTSVSSGVKLEVNGDLKVYGAVTSPVGTLRDDEGGWIRTYGNTGWYSQTHGGGWYMSDSNWIRSYGNKHIYQNSGTMRTDGTFQVGGGSDIRFLVEKNGNVGIGTTDPDEKLDVNGTVKATHFDGDGSLLTNLNASNINGTISEEYNIGDCPELGGYVFMLSEDNKHGLVAAKKDQSTNCIWYDTHDVISNPDNHDEDGKKFRDWRPPTKYELDQMYNYYHESGIGGFANESYWSSTERDTDDAWRQDFFNGDPLHVFKGNVNRVRAVRAF